MTLDHLGFLIFPGCEPLRILGRLAFPIFAFFISEGCRYTHDRLRYFLRLLVLGAAFAAVYYIAVGELYINIMLSFALASGLVFVSEPVIKRMSEGKLSPFAGTLLLIVELGAVAALCCNFTVDYGFWGVLSVCAAYYAGGKYRKLAAMGVFLAIYSVSCGVWFQFFCLLSLPLLALYNGTRGKLRMKYFFYIYYPLHMAIIYLISLLLSRS